MTLAELGLKPCPFCGQDNTLEIATNHRSRRPFLVGELEEVDFLRVKCACGANFEIEGEEHYISPIRGRMGISAIDKWNRRGSEDE